ncbi:MAG: hypothetical protein ACK2UK_01575 [Candidatus Promineifilaceae bacterium]
MNEKRRRIIHSFAVEMLIYSIMVTVYLYLVITYLEAWLVSLYDNDLVVYAFVALFFIVAQSVFLDSLTTFIMDRLGLERLK